VWRFRHSFGLRAFAFDPEAVHQAIKRGAVDLEHPRRRLTAVGRCRRRKALGRQASSRPASQHGRLPGCHSGPQGHGTPPFTALPIALPVAPLIVLLIVQSTALRVARSTARSTAPSIARSIQHRIARSIPPSIAPPNAPATAPATASSIALPVASVIASAIARKNTAPGITSRPSPPWKSRSVSPFPCV